ncbi:MAG: thiamine phosphate synthase [Candidatus Rokubacteria bacterium]|nr:thiamine phosphate synthase [Candidatus Rokubacteria bacterium]
MDELRLCLVTDRSRCPDLVPAIAACVAAGLRAVQLREKDLGALELAALARRVREVTRGGDAMLIVNDRVDVALAVGADAVQRTGASLTVADMRAVAGARLRIGASVHSRAEALDADAAGADFIVFGPVYDTPSKRRFGPPQGLAALEAVAAAVRVPVVAIGGVTPARVPELMTAGAAGIAVISGILAAPSPAVATREFLEAIDKCRTDNSR